MTGTRPRHPGRPAGSAARPNRAPTIPSGLGSAGQAAWRAAWRTTWLTAHDRETVELLARTADFRARLLEQIDAGSAIVRGSKGQDAANPLLIEVRHATSQLTRLQTLLGLNPAGRKRLGIETTEPKGDPDPMEEFLSRPRQRRSSIHAA